MTFSASFDGPLLVLRLSGTLTAADLEALANEVLSVEREGSYAPNRMTDLREVTDATIGYAEMSRLIDRTVARPLLTPVRSALLVTQPVQLGFARMFQILNEHPKVMLQIFEDETEAREWLAVSPPD